MNKKDKTTDKKNNSVEDGQVLKDNYDDVENIENIDNVNLDEYTQVMLKKVKSEIDELINERISTGEYNEDNNPLTVDAAKSIFKDVYRIAISNKNRVVFSLANYTSKEVKESETISNIETYFKNESRMKEIEKLVEEKKTSVDGLDEVENRLNNLKKLENY